MTAPVSDSWRPIFKRRLLIAAAIFMTWAGAIQVRLIYLQVLRHADLEARGERQSDRTIDIAARRGDIVDRHGRVLAYSVESDSVYAVPREIGGDAARSAALLCGALGDCTVKERTTLAVKLGQKKSFAWVRRQVSQAQSRKIAALQLPGIGFTKEDRRFYPNKELAAQLLGFVGRDNKGLAGIEAAYDGQIRGAEGKLLYQTDAHHRAFSRLERPPTAGGSVELTIDEYLQHIVERELRDGVAENRAASGTAIVMDPRSGEILALASVPTFNPNEFSSAEAPQLRNRAVQDIYEPGSTFKVVTASAALEEHIAAVDQMIDARGGRIKIGSRVIPDTHDYGMLSFTDVIVKSSNVGAIRIGLSLGAERLGRYARRFGFGRALSPDFPAETSGIVWDPAKLDASALASMSMGYQVGVTPLQMAAAVSSVANGGTLMQPRVVRSLNRDGNRIEVKPHAIGRAILPDTAAAMTSIMEQVVQRGTATYAQVDGYTIAGKTGTAHKLINGRYSQTDFYASFVGFLPSRKPVATIIVVIDTPRSQGHFGGPIAGPIFQRIARATLRHYGIAPTLNAPPPVLVSRRQDGPQMLPARAVRDPKILPVTGPADGRDFPDFRGLSGREVLKTITLMGLTARLHGDGTVTSQTPSAGSPIRPGAVCEFWLERTPLTAASFVAEP